MTKATMNICMKTSLAMTFVALLLFGSTNVFAGPIPSADALGIDLVIARAESSNTILSSTPTLDPTTTSTSDPSLPIGSPGMSNAPVSSENPKQSLAKSVLEYLFLAVAVLLIAYIIARRLLTLRSQKRPFYHFFYTRDPSSPPEYTHHHAPGFAPQTLPPLPAGVGRSMYPDHLSSSHLTPPSSAYLGFNNRTTHPRAARRTTAADIDASGRRGGGGPLVADQEHDWDGFLTGRDVLPAYDVFGGPPKYSETMRNTHGGATEMSSLGRATASSNGVAETTATATAATTTMSLVGIGAGGISSRRVSSSSRAGTRHRARRSRRVEGSEGSGAGDVTVAMSMSIVGFHPTASVSSFERERHDEGLTQLALGRDNGRIETDHSSHGRQEQNGGELPEQQPPMVHPNHAISASTIAAGERPPRETEYTAFATSTSSPELPQLSSPELISLPSPVFASTHPTFLSRLLLPHDRESDSHTSTLIHTSRRTDSHEFGRRHKEENRTSHSLSNVSDSVQTQTRIPSLHSQSQNINILQPTHDASISTIPTGTHTTVLSHPPNGLLMSSSSNSTSPPQTP